MVLNGCVTSSSHTKKGDLNQADISKTVEAYFSLDADTPEKKALIEQARNARVKAYIIANEDPSILVKGDQAFNALDALGFGGGALGLASVGWSILRGKKFKGLIQELVSEPDEKECLRKVNRFKHA